MTSNSTRSFPYGAVSCCSQPGSIHLRQSRIPSSYAREIPCRAASYIRVHSPELLRSAKCYRFGLSAHATPASRQPERPSGQAALLTHAHMPFKCTRQRHSATSPLIPRRTAVTSHLACPGAPTPPSRPCIAYRHAAPSKALPPTLNPRVPCIPRTMLCPRSIQAAAAAAAGCGRRRWPGRVGCRQPPGRQHGHGGVPPATHRQDGYVPVLYQNRDVVIRSLVLAEGLTYPSSTRMALHVARGCWQ